MSELKKVINRRLITKEEIRERRLLLGLTPRQLGEYCYMSKQTVLNIEKGVSKLPQSLYLLELVTDMLLEQNGYEKMDCALYKKIGPGFVRLEKKEI